MEFHNNNQIRVEVEDTPSCALDAIFLSLQFYIRFSFNFSAIVISDCGNPYFEFGKRT